jgi:pSer/pThr/pTyr-binding forkhead associated (FHA) protein/Mg-chelatase subunit ChlD
MRLLAMMAIIGAFEGRITSAQIPTNQPVDVMLALDNSGSMRHNDPQGLVKQAVTEFASHLPAQSQVGIVRFDQRIQVIQPLTKVSDPGFSSILANSLKQIDYSGKWTDIPGGIERGIYTLNHDGRPDALHALVFFTDGIVETGNSAKDMERSKWLRESLAAEAKQKGIRIFGVGFTEDSDYELIQSVAQTTGGEHYRVLKASDVARTFREVGKKVVEPLPVATPQPAAPAVVQQPSWIVPLWVGGGVGLILLVVLVVIILRRQGSGPGSQEGSENIPSPDFAHLIDVGRHTGSERIQLRKRRVRIGRESKLNDVCIAEGTVSSQHAVIEYRDGCYYLRDLRSSNGTFINGKQMSDPDSVRETMLKPGDRVRFDAYEFVFDLDVSAGSAAPGAGNTVDHRKTALRVQPAQTPVKQPSTQREPVVSPVRDATKPDAERVQPAPTIKKEARDANGPANTWVKKETCPTHPSWQATELCPKCGVGKCKLCMTERNGKPICVDCANMTGGLTA